MQTLPSADLPSLRRRDFYLLAAVIVLTSLVRLWIIWHTSVPARDGVGLIRYAWQLEHRPWREVLRDNAHPPLYPLAIVAASSVVRLFLHASEPVIMQVGAQAASAFAGVLLVIPMFLLGRRLFNSTVALGAAVLFQFLPVPARVTSDVLTESLFLLLTATALFYGVKALRSRSMRAFALCGLFTGLAYLTRPEGLLVALSAAAVLLFVQWIPELRRPWTETVRHAAALTLGAACVALPYMVVIGGVSMKPNAARLLGTPDAEADPESRAEPAFVPPTLLQASMLAVRWDLHGTDRRVLQAGKAVIFEVGKSAHLAWIPALWGLWCSRRRFRTQPEVWIVAVTCGSLAVLVGRIALVRGYVSERHALVFILCGVFWASFGLAEFARWLSNVWRKRPSFISPARVEWLLIGGLAIAGVPEILKPLHGNRAGHRLAGAWLAENAEPRARLLDPFCWADYYSGRAFEDASSPAPTSRAAETYVIAEQSKLEHRWLRGRDQAAELISRGIPVFRCPLQRGSSAEVVVYRVVAGAGAATGN